MNPDGGGYIRKIIFEPGGDDLVIPGALGGEPFPGILGDAVQRHDPHPLRIIIPLRAGHPTLAGGDALVGVEREARDVSRRANGLPPVSRGVESRESRIESDFRLVDSRLCLPPSALRPPSSLNSRWATMRGILDDLKVESLGERRHPGHIPDLTPVVDRQNRHHLFAAGNRLFNPPFGIGEVHAEIHSRQSTSSGVTLK